MKLFLNTIIDGVQKKKNMDFFCDEKNLTLRQIYPGGGSISISGIHRSIST